MVESFLRQAGVRFKRDFSLTPQGVGEALRANLGVSFAENRVFLPLEDVRPAINYLPLPKGSPARAVTSKPIMAVLPCRDRDRELCIHYGNRTITLIKPDWREMDHSLEAVRVTVVGARGSGALRPGAGRGRNGARASTGGLPGQRHRL